MFATLNRVPRALVGRVRSLLRRLPGGLKVPREEHAILRHLRKRSRTVDAVARHTKLSADTALAALIDLESRGLVKLSPDQGSGHTRIAALTTAGRDALKQGRL